LSQFKKDHLSGNLKFNKLGIFQSLKFRTLVKKKILPVSEKLNFNVGCFELIRKNEILN